MHMAMDVGHDSLTLVLLQKLGLGWRPKYDVSTLCHVDLIDSCAGVLGPVVGKQDDLLRGDLHQQLLQVLPKRFVFQIRIRVIDRGP